MNYADKMFLALFTKQTYKLPLLHTGVKLKVCTRESHSSLSSANLNMNKKFYSIDRRIKGDFPHQGSIL